MITTDCSDVASGAIILSIMTGVIGFTLGWWIKKAEMLQEWKTEKSKQEREREERNG